MFKFVLLFAWFMLGAGIESFVDLSIPGTILGAFFLLIATIPYIIKSNEGEDDYV